MDGGGEGVGKEKKRGWRYGPLPVCLRSVGTSCVSHFLSTIKVNELFRFCSGASLTGKTYCPEVVICEDSLHQLFFLVPQLIILISFPKFLHETFFPWSQVKY